MLLLLLLLLRVRLRLTVVGTLGPLARPAVIAERRLRKDRAVLEGHARGDGTALEVRDVPIVVADTLVGALL